MTDQELQRYAYLVRNEATHVLDTWRQEVAKLPSAQHLSVPVLNDHIPFLIEEVATAFESRTDVSITEALLMGTPTEHGEQRLADGFDIVEIVAEYNILRGGLHDLAVTNGLNMAGRAFHILNRVFDGSIGLAVESFASQQAKEVKQRREEYLAFVTHDLRTPLGAILLTANILEVPERGTAAERARWFTVLRRNLAHVNTLVDQVLEENSNLAVEVGVKLERRHFDLWPKVEGLIHDIRPAGGSGNVDLINEVPVELVVFADASLVGRILQNLIGNAMTHTERGEIRIGANERTEEDLIECWVSDTGKGIAAHRLGEVFQKGEGDADRVESAGLGLAIVKTFVEAHGGAVHAESVEGQGSTIRFTLPKR
jgi:two-component system, OmpR family, phosphate regulon sensor histidine kinase PhoR